MATTDAPSQVPTVPRTMSRTDSATAMNREGFKCKVRTTQRQRIAGWAHAPGSCAFSCMLFHTIVHQVPKNLTLNIVVFGASGDLAKKKTYPALFELHRKGCVCWSVPFVGATLANCMHQQA